MSKKKGKQDIMIKTQKTHLTALSCSGSTSSILKFNFKNTGCLSVFFFFFIQAQRALSALIKSVICTLVTQSCQTTDMASSHPSHLTAEGANGELINKLICFTPNSWQGEWVKDVSGKRTYTPKLDEIALPWSALHIKCMELMNYDPRNYSTQFPDIIF